MKSHASMNRIYRLVWNTALSLWVAVAENAKGRGKGGSARGSVLFASAPAGAGEGGGIGFMLNSACCGALVLVISMAVFTHQAQAANAADASVAAGTGNVSTAGNTTTINQASQRMAIDWTSLSTAANEALRFNQPNAQAIALNRITGSNPSALLGSLTANGQVFILNPNGVLFGAGSQVNVGGLVASTLSMSNADFMAGNHVFSNNGSSGSVVNQGNLNAGQGGYLALLAPEVRNEGVMTASLGTALLAAGNKVTLTLGNGSLLGYSIDEGAINALAENKQLIKADGGQVLLGAKALDGLTTGTVNNTGVIEAKTMANKAGRIMLIGDMEHGMVNIGGTLDASAPDGGDGGFIETSAANFKILPGFRVNTRAPQGKTGTWLLDPTTMTIAGGTGGAVNTIYEDAIEVAGADVTIQATDSIFVTGTFSNADVELPGGLNLTIRTTGVGGGTGIDLTSSTHGAGLTFKTSGGGTVTVATSNAAQAIKTSAISVTGGGTITLDSAGVLDISNTTLQTAGGAISLTGVDTVGFDGVKISKGIVNAGTGALTITGSTTTGNSGVNIENALGESLLTGGTVNITGSTTGGNYGVRIDRSRIFASNGLTLDSATGDSRMYLQGAVLTATGGDILIKARGASTVTPSALLQSLFIEDVAGIRSKILNTGAGNITIDAQLASHGSSTGSPTALLVRNSDITTSTGTINLTGATGTSGNVDSTTGVRLDSGAIVTGAGSVSITGTAGATAFNGSTGASIANGAQVSSSGGNVTVSGTLNNPAALSGQGAQVAGKLAASNGTVGITGTATVGAGSGSGVLIDSGADISAGLGVTVTGTAASAAAATALVGAQMNGGSISSAGGIAMNGNLSAPAATGVQGLNLAGGTVSATGAGTVSLTGSGVPAGASASSYALNLQGTSVSSAGGAITLRGDRVNIGSAVNAGAGRVVINPVTNTLAITLAGASETTAMNLSNAELNQITASVIAIGGTANTGGISIGNTGAAINLASSPALSLINSSASGAISQTAAITVGNLNADARNVTLSNGSNQFSQVSGRAYGTGTFLARSASAMSVGTVDGTAGITHSGTGGVSLISSGALTQTQAIVANTFQASSFGGMTLANAGNQIQSFGNFNNGTSGGITIRNTAANASFLGSLITVDRVDIANTGDITLGISTLSNSSNATGTTAGTAAMSIVATGGISVLGAAAHIQNSAGGSVYLEAGNGSIGVNPAGAVNISTAGAVTAVANGGASQVNLALAGGASVENISAPGAVNVTAAAGDLAVKTVAGSSVTLGAAAGAILDANGAANNVTGTTLNATALNGITLGTNVTGLQTLATTGATGDITLTAANALSSSNLAITTNAGAAQTVSISSGAGITVDSAFGNVQDKFKLTTTGGSIAINGALTASELTLSTTGTSTQTAAITATGLELLGTGTHTLNNAGNAVTTLAGNTGNAAYSQAGALAVGTVNTAGLTASGKVLVRTTGAASDLTLNNSVTSGSAANDSLVLAAGRNFVNNAGAGALNPGAGRFLVYSTSPLASTLGGMVSTGNAFGRTYAGNLPSDASMTSLSGNRFVYSAVPTLTVSGDNQSKAFGGADPALTYTVNSGLVAGDTAATALGGALSAPTGAATTGPTHAITQGTLASALGYNVAYTNGTLTMTGAPPPAPSTTPSTLPTPSPASSFGVTAALDGAYVTAINTIAGTDKPLGGSTDSESTVSNDASLIKALNDAAAEAVTLAGGE